jgi:methylglyoxal synthase
MTLKAELEKQVDQTIEARSLMHLAIFAMDAIICNPRDPDINLLAGIRDVLYILRTATAEAQEIMEQAAMQIDQAARP